MKFLGLMAMFRVYMEDAYLKLYQTYKMEIFEKKVYLNCLTGF